jgi:hypothetical protein
MLIVLYLPAFAAVVVGVALRRDIKSMLIFRSIALHPLTFECNRHTVTIFMSNPIFPYGDSSYIALVSLAGFWRPFVHHGDNLIHQLLPANVFDFDSFSDSLVGGPTPMPNSPIAVVSWGVNKFDVSVSLILYPDQDTDELAGSRILYYE